MEKLNQTVGFAAHNVCRRTQLLHFFGEEYPSENCGSCDICSGTVEQIDVTIDAQIVMSAMSRTQQRFGIGHILDVVTGADTKRIRDLQHNAVKTYGAGKQKDKKHWRFLVDELLAQGFIRQDGDRYPVLKLTQKGSDVLFGQDRGGDGLVRESAALSIPPAHGVARAGAVVRERRRGERLPHRIVLGGGVVIHGQVRRPGVRRVAVNPLIAPDPIGWRAALIL